MEWATVVLILVFLLFFILGLWATMHMSYVSRDLATLTFVMAPVDIMGHRAPYVYQVWSSL